MERIHILYFFFCCFACLSLYNYMRLAELQRGDKDSVGIHEHRQRREAQDEDDWRHILNLNVDKLTAFVKEKANETFQDEINKVLDKLIVNFPVKRLCKDISIKCQQDLCNQDATGKKVVGDSGVMTPKAGNKASKMVCLPGPRGPPGPVGPPGKRGLGLREPKLVNSTSTITAKGSDDVTFECVFFGNPIPSVKWTSNSDNIKILQSIDVEKSQVTSRLIISNVTWSDRGKVVCKAKSLLGEAASTTNLNVLSRPIINLENGPFFVPRGINYQFPECEVRSFPEAKITWKRYFFPLPKGRHFTSGGLLNISRVTYEDEGFYVCEAENYLGKTKKRVQLKTKSLELFEKPLPNFSNAVEANITCSAYGNPSQMSGKIVRINNGNRAEEEVETTVVLHENIFSVSAVVNITGTYKCSINFKQEQVNAYTLVEMFDLPNSRILRSEEDIRVLGSWLQEYNALGEYAQCYNSQRDGNTFYSRCGGQSNTVTLFKTSYYKYYRSYEAIYGGFTDAAWVQASYPYYRYNVSDSQNTFVFNMNMTDGPVKFDANPGSSMTVCYYNYGPCFGNRELYITNNYGSRFNIYGNQLREPTFGDFQFPSIARGKSVTVEVYYKI